MRYDPTVEAALAECAREPIHRLGRTQSFGVLLALDRQRRIACASANAERWLGRAAASLIGDVADAVLPRRSVDAAVAHARVAAALGAPQHLFGVGWPGRREPVDVSIHDSGGLVVIEAEPSAGGPPEAALAVATGTRELALRTTVDALAASAAQTVARITGYDRVMVYRFAADGSGCVIAEHLKGRQAPYLGLRYPASDIPAQARELYLRNPTRVIADAADDGLELVGGSALPPDLSLSTLRSVSPVHLQYMRNMGAAASMSVSLVIDGRLWGLIACHHRRPMHPTLARRSMAELLGRLYSVAIARTERQTMDREIEALLLRSPGVEPLVDPSASPEAREAAGAAAGRLFGASGLMVTVHGRTASWGHAPDIADAMSLTAALAGAGERLVVAFESLESAWPGLKRLAPGVAGMLAVPLAPQWSSWVLLLRDEVLRHVTWAGDPRKPLDTMTGRLTPRGSFAAWRESVHWHCEPWAAAQLELAEVLRVRLIELLVAQHEQRELDQTRRSARQQALLVRELNHRVRNMLGLIKGLVQQTARGSSSVEQLAERLHDRVHALSRAYSQIEKARWQPAPLATLLDDETRAFGEPGQVVLNGVAVDLEPNAYLAFALVVHELATNARKYGALSRPEGRLRVDWRVTSERTLELDWLESGGPPVAPLRHGGFGTRVIGQALSHQLGGRAQLAFKPEGLRARLMTPQGFVPGTVVPATPAQRPVTPAAEPPQHALVVEDDLVIALTAEAMLRKLGCLGVVVTGTTADALEALRTQRFDVALLDVRLGDDDSGAVALRLAELGVPALVTTGYADADDLPAALRALPRIGKPYTEGDLGRAFAGMRRTR